MFPKLPPLSDVTPGYWYLSVSPFLRQIRHTGRSLNIRIFSIVSRELRFNGQANILDNNSFCTISIEHTHEVRTTRWRIKLCRSTLRALILAKTSQNNCPELPDHWRHAFRMKNVGFEMLVSGLVLYHDTCSVFGHSDENIRFHREQSGMIFRVIDLEEKPLLNKNKNKKILSCKMNPSTYNLYVK